MPLFARSTDRRDFFATTCALLENLSCDPSASFSIGQRVVVIFEMKPASLCHCMELVIWQFVTERSARGATGAIKGIFRIVHVVGIKNSSETRLIKWTVVRHKREFFRQTPTQFSPHLRKRALMPRVLCRQSVNSSGERRIIIGNRADQAVILIGYFTVSHHYNPNTAHTAALPVGCFKVNRYKVFHRSVILEETKRHILSIYQRLITFLLNNSKKHSFVALISAIASCAPSNSRPKSRTYNSCRRGHLGPYFPGMLQKSIVACIVHT